MNVTFTAAAAESWTPVRSAGCSERASACQYRAAVMNRPVIAMKEHALILVMGMLKCEDASHGAILN